MLLKGAYCVGEHFVDPQCDLKRKRNNNLFTGNLLNITFVKLYPAVLHQGLHCLLRKKLFR